MPDAEQVVRGWRAHLDRGMRVDLPDPELQAAVDSARAQLLLAGQAWLAVPEVVIALEDWGFDDEARRRVGSPRHVRPTQGRPSPVGSRVVGRRASATRPAVPLRSSTRSAARSSTREAPTSNCSSALPREWRGLPLDVRDAPTKLGPVSYSLRWHGDRAALLWDVPAGARVRIPGVDALWSSDEPRGETLLAPMA